MSSFSKAPSCILQQQVAKVIAVAGVVAVAVAVAGVVAVAVVLVVAGAVGQL